MVFFRILTALIEQITVSCLESDGTGTDIDYLLYDGYGSTRQLIDSTGTPDGIIDSFSYDAYGVMLGGNPGSVSNPSSPATNLLYAGEHFDTDAQQYYLRARWYNPLNGLFNRTDPFSGSPQDPQSLHKYLYCHANPVNTIDPSGEFTGMQLTIALVVITILLVAIVLAIWYYSCEVALTGSEPAYNPALWNSPNYISYNNCYAYAVNDPVPYPTRTSKPQPGVKAGSPYTSITVSAVKTAAIADGLKYLGNTPRSTLSIKKTDYVVALVVAPGADYHWYRHNPDGTWSHKPGGTAATNVDASRALVRDPRTANRNYGIRNYTDFGGYFAVPAGGIRVKP